MYRLVRIKLMYVLCCVAGMLFTAATQWRVLREKSRCGSKSMILSAGKKALSTGYMYDALSVPHLHIRTTSGVA